MRALLADLDHIDEIPGLSRFETPRRNARCRGSDRCYRPAKGALKLGLGHRRAPADVPTLRLLVELVAHAPARSPRWLRLSPRLPDEMSSRESFDELLASPLRARSLLTVRAAISPLVFRRATLLQRVLDVLVLACPLRTLLRPTRWHSSPPSLLTPTAYPERSRAQTSVSARRNGERSAWQANENERGCRVHRWWSRRAHRRSSCCSSGSSESPVALERQVLLEGRPRSTFAGRDVELR